MGRFDYSSPGGDATLAIRGVLAEQEELRRQAVVEELNRVREARLAEQGKRDDEIARETLAAMKGQRESTEALNRSRILKEQTDQSERLYNPGQYLSTDQAENVPIGLRVADKALSASTIAIPASPMSPAIPAQTLQGGDFRYTGTSDERDRQRLMEDPNTPENRRQYLRAVGDSGTISAQMFDDTDTTKTLILKGRDNSLKQFQSGQWVPLVGEVPKNAQVINEASETDANGRPYYIPVQTGEGVMVLDSRTGKLTRGADLRPGATAESELVRGGSMLYTLDNITNQFSPQWLGPIKGRYNTMQLALVGESGQEGLATMAATLRTFQNTVINLRTGAQMSEEEAQRILGETPDINLPPDVFLARLNSAKTYFEDWYKRREALAYGRPNENPTVPGVTGGPTTSGQPTAPVTPGAETPEQRRNRLRNYLPPAR